MDKKKVSPFVLLDISKAFDSINHEILLNKLQDVSFSPFHITWFNNYLCERHRVIRINNELSEPLPVESGVPQAVSYGLSYLVSTWTIYHLIPALFIWKLRLCY